MSATNTTTNYNLPIFVSTDKPAWLVDFNGAMTAIDAQMKNNADAIALKSPILTFSDTTDIDFTVTGSTVEASLDAGVAGTISRAFTKPVSAPASAQIPSVDTSNVQQLLDIGSGLKVDRGALTAIDLDLTDITTYEYNSAQITVTGNATLTSGSFTIALNASKTIGKIYGGCIANNTTTSGAPMSITLGKTVAATGSAYIINPAGIGWRTNLPAAGSGNVTTPYIDISAFGVVTMKFTAQPSSSTCCNWFPCIYFFKNFGDVPTP